MAEALAALHGEAGEVAVHWIQGTVPAEKRAELVAYLERRLEAKADDRDWGRFRYDRHVWFEAYSVGVYYDSSIERGQAVHDGRAALVIPGSVCDLWTAEQLLEILRDLSARFWFMATRIDVFWDDFGRRVALDEIEAAAEAGDVSGFRVYERIAPKRIGVQGAEKTGDSVTFGHRGKEGCGKFLRVYDKGLESAGERDCIRWEVEFSKERAQVVGFELAQVESVEALGVVLGGLVGGTVDFLKRGAASGGDRHLDRLSRLEFWERVIALLGKVVVRNSVPAQSIERTQAHIEQAYGISLAMVRAALGEGPYYDWIARVTSGGDPRMKRKHQALLLRHAQEKGCPSDQVAFA